jgi:hypothetical protein
VQTATRPPPNVTSTPAGRVSATPTPPSPRPSGGSTPSLQPPTQTGHRIAT